MKKRHIWLCSLAISFLAAANTFAQTAGAWPNKAIKIVIPAAAGSAPDIMTRLVALELQKRLGQPVVGDNKPGAGGALGSDIARGGR